MSDNLNKMLSSIEYQLSSSRLNSHKSNDEHYLYSARKENKSRQSNDKTKEENKSLQMTNDSSFNSFFSPRTSETQKVIARELEPFISSVRTELSSAIETFRKESKDVTLNKWDLEAYKQMISSNTQSLAKLDDYTRGELHHISETTRELNCNYVVLRDKHSEANQRLSELSFDVNNIKEEVKLAQVNELKAKKDNRSSFSITENRVKEIIDDRLNQFERSIEMKMSQIIKSLNCNDHHNKSNDDNSEKIEAIEQSIEELKNTNDSNQKEKNRISSIVNTSERQLKNQKEEIDLLKAALKCMKENVAKSNKSNSDTNSQINALNQQSINDLKEEYSLLNNQTNILMNKISSFQSNQKTLSNELNQLKEGNSEISFNRQSDQTQKNNQYGKLTEEMLALASAFDNFKKEQKKLNELNEKILKSVSNQLLCLNKDTKSLIESKEGVGANLESIQENFNRIDAKVAQCKKLESDFNAMTETVKNLSLNSKKLQNEVDANFVKWKKEAEETISKKVNVIKKEYDDKLNLNKNNSNLAKEYNAKLDQFEMLSRTQYATKIDLEILKNQVYDIENSVKADKDNKDLADNSRKNSKNAKTNKKKEETHSKNPIPIPQMIK